MQGTARLTPQPKRIAAKTHRSQKKRTGNKTALWQGNDWQRNGNLPGQAVIPLPNIPLPYFLASGEDVELLRCKGIIRPRISRMTRMRWMQFKPGIGVTTKYTNHTKTKAEEASGSQAGLLPRSEGRVPGSDLLVRVFRVFRGLNCFSRFIRVIRAIRGFAYFPARMVSSQSPGAGVGNWQVLPTATATAGCVSPVRGLVQVASIGGSGLQPTPSRRSA
jgi:hypothetical protein